MQNLSGARVVANDFIKFLNKAVTPYHAVEECASLLAEAGFQEIKEDEKWSLRPASKYFLTRNKSTIIAFATGGRFQPGNGISMVAAHTDSPCLKVKPISKLSSANFSQVGVMTYGGGLWRTWFDRDLTLAGRVLLKADDGKISNSLVHIKRPIMSIPNLAIHLDRKSNESFVFNSEDHLRPILASQVSEKLNNSDSKPKELPAEAHHASVINLIASELNTGAKNIIDFDLNVIDVQPAVIGGIDQEFIYGARLDNLVSTYSSITALIKSCQNADNLQRDSCVRFVVCYDNEECGSESAQGAASALTEWILRRLHAEMTGCNPSSDICAFERSIARSFLISADQAHAQHPNYKVKHEENHAPRFHGGPVVKINANQRYATTAFTNSFITAVSELAQIPLQKFVVRNDSQCGSTVGPILSAKLGLKTVDIGTPQLAMHSIREMSCISGVAQAQKLFQVFFEYYEQLLNQFKDAA